ncbi:MAG: PTS sugar transporter subunit IIA [Spirochaeta sp.]|nr:PTS sugar transporter subunit IIA [Spirochaeta sp.]
MKAGQEPLCITQTDLSSKDDILDLVARTAISSPALARKKTKEILRLLHEREKLTSTAIGHGVAIPHCFIDGIDEFVLGVITTTHGIEYGAADSEAVRIFFFIIGPSDQRNQHIKLLSEISRTVRVPENREQILSAQQPQELNRIVQEFLVVEPEQKEEEQCLLQVFVQREAIFEPILELLSSRVEGSIAVQELKNAGSYLYRMPLFAAMWSEQTDRTVKLIYAVIDKNIMNDLARQIHQLAYTKKGNSGVLITAQQLLYADGALDF